MSGAITHSHAQCSTYDHDFHTAICETLLHAHVGSKTTGAVRTALRLLTDCVSLDGSYTGALLRPSEGNEQLKQACTCPKLKERLTHVLLLFKYCERLSQALPSKKLLGNGEGVCRCDAQFYLKIRLFTSSRCGKHYSNAIFVSYPRCSSV